MANKKDNIYVLSASDGLGNVTKVEFPKRELQTMIAKSIWQTVLASAAIEGENIEGLEMPQELIDQVPDSLLETKE